MKNVLRCFLLMMCSLPLMAAASAGPDLLNRWVGGKWVSEGKMVDTDYSKANQANAVSTCAWSPDHVFVICDQDIKFGVTPMRDLSIYTLDPKTNKFYFYGISLGQEKPRNPSLQISADGGRWEYLSADEINGKTIQFRATNQFHGNDSAEWWTEYSTDGGKTWTRTGQGTETRQK